MTVKWGIIGCGAVAEHKGGPALYNAPDSELIAVMRRDEQLAAEFAQRHGAKRHYSSVEAILADGEINAVYIATPPHVHAEQTIAAANAGKHVLCEKPMAMNVGQGREMIAACRNNGVQLMIAYYRRFWPLASKMQQLIADGAIGRPTMAYAHCAALWQPPEDPSTFWRIQRDIAGGGFLWDVGSHRLDLLIQMMGDVTSVAAMVEAVHFDIPVDDSSALLMQFESGAQGIGMFYWNVGSYVDALEVAGTAGRLIATSVGQGELLLARGTDTEQFHLPPPEITHLPLVEHYVAAIISGEPNALPGEEGLKTTAVIQAADTSARNRDFVTISELP
jgi:predicted dehydrogenase